MIISNDILDRYKKDPRKFDYDAGFSRAGIDFWRGETVVFDETHSKAYRDGYIAGYTQSMENEEHITIDYEKALAITRRTFDEKAIVKYGESPETSTIDWHGVVELLNSRGTNNASD